VLKGLGQLGEQLQALAVKLPHTDKAVAATPRPGCKKEAEGEAALVLALMDGVLAG
jgi:hypothetical protein